MHYLNKKLIQCIPHLAAVLTLAFAGLSGCHKSDSSGKGPVVSFRIQGSDGLSLTSNLALRLADIKFDVFVTCDPEGNTSSLTFENYTLGDIEQFSLDAGCTNPDVNLKNIDVSYTNVDNNVVAGTFVNYASTITNNNSTLLFEKTVTGTAAEFRFREKIVVGQSNSHVVAVIGMQVTAELLNKPNSYCSGVTVALAANTVTATFDAPEAGTPAGTYIFSADRSALPASAVEVKSGASVSYDFSAVTGGESTATYVFTMEMIPEVGQPHADEICTATVSINVQPAAINHAPTFHYDNHLNVTDFTGLGTETDPYAFTLVINSTNGQVSFRITDEDGQATALIECNNKPAWVTIDDTNDRITFSPTSSGTVTFDCHANDGTINSFTSVFFQITTNTPPTISFVQPMGDDDYVLAGSDFAITWNDADPDDNAMIGLYLKTTSTGACSDGTLLVDNISEDDSADTWTFSANLASGVYYVCARIVDSVNPAVEVHSGALAVYRECTWTGADDALWSTSNNWSSCGGLPPQSTDRVLIPVAASPQPSITANTSISGFFAGVGGGTVTIGADTILRILAPNRIESSVGFAGATDACVNCWVINSANVLVHNDAKLSLFKGIGFSFANAVDMNIGSSTSAGHLYASGGADNSHWPRLAKSPELPGWGSRGNITLRGASELLRSTFEVDGLKISGMGDGRYAVIFNGFFDIQKFDNVHMNDINHTIRYGGFIQFQSCASSLSVNDFNNLQFNVGHSWFAWPFANNFGNTTIGRGWNVFVVDTANCTTANGFDIEISGSGRAYGESIERDVPGIISWVNGASFTCVWNGSVSTAWHDPDNWDSCINNRGNFPDQNDFVRIPSGTPFAPAITGAYIQIQGFAPGVGGGTVTIHPNSQLKLINATNTISSSVLLQGQTPECSTCQVYQTSGMKINQSATLTLGHGLRIRSGYYSEGLVQVGDGVTAGHLKVVPQTGDQTHWPFITGIGSTASWYGITVNGTSSERSTIEIDGLHVEVVHTNFNKLTFIKDFEILKFDYIRLDHSGTAVQTRSGIRFDGCSNAVISDTTWSAIEFSDIYNGSGGHNIHASAASCSTLPEISVSGSGPGFGSEFELDPFSRFSW